MKRLCFLFFPVIAMHMAACTEKGERRVLIELEELVIEGHPCKDYSWTYVMSPEGIVRESAKGHRQKPDDKDRVGAESSFLFVFEGIEPGETELRFTYERPWENKEPFRTSIYIMKVNTELLINSRWERVIVAPGNPCSVNP